MEKGKWIVTLSVLDELLKDLKFPEELILHADDFLDLWLRIQPAERHQNEKGEEQWFFWRGTKIVCKQKQRQMGSKVDLSKERFFIG